MLFVLFVTKKYYNTVTRSILKVFGKIRTKTWEVTISLTLPLYHINIDDTNGLASLNIELESSIRHHIKHTASPDSYVKPKTNRLKLKLHLYAAASLIKSIAQRS